MKNIVSLFLSSALLFTSNAWAHDGHRPRIGAPNQQTPTGAPETWGTYCVTELAPLFREALTIYNQNNRLIDMTKLLMDTAQYVEVMANAAVHQKEQQEKINTTSSSSVEVLDE